MERCDFLPFPGYFLQGYLVLWSRHQRGQSTTLFYVLLVLFWLAHSPRPRPSLFGDPRGLSATTRLEVALRHAAYSIDAICVGALWCGDRTLPSVMPTKNIVASIKAITPSFLGGVSLRICLSKSS